MTEDRLNHFFGDYSNLSTKHKRTQARKRANKIREAQKKEEMRLEHEVNKILEESKKERRLRQGEIYLDGLFCETDIFT